MVTVSVLIGIDFNFRRWVSWLPDAGHFRNYVAVSPAAADIDAINSQGKERIGYSKKLENHAHMVALYAVWYNFVKTHKAHKLSPAMAAGVTDKLWSMEDLAGMIEAAQPAPAKRGPYKKREAA
jgi:hypothetical protein